MATRFLTFLKLVDIYANVFNWVEIRTLSYELDLLTDSISRIEHKISQVEDIVNILENRFEINLYSFRAQKDRERLEHIFNQ